MVGYEMQGLAEMRAALKRVAAMSVEDLGIVATMVSEGETMMNLSKHMAPVLDGTLRAGGIVDVPRVVADDVELVIGYGGAAKAYAWKVHENPRAGKTGGVSPKGRRYKRWATTGQWKFLETPVAQRRQAYFDAIGQRVFERAVKVGSIQ